MTPSARSGGWILEQVTGSAHDFHARPLPDPPRREVWVFHADRPALVLGSAQRADVVDVEATDRAGVEVVKRHSGGGAVLVVPGEVTWVDVVIPADDPLWEADVGAAFLWLGRTWRDVLTASTAGTAPRNRAGVPAIALDAAPFAVHDGPLARSRWSELVCFAGLGPGEVTAAGQKIVGLSQRRTRHAARFQTIVHHRFRAQATAAYLALPQDERALLGSHLEHAVGTVSTDPTTLRERWLTALPG